MGAPPALLVLGDLVTDVVALHGKPLAPGTDTSARISLRPGGSAANTAAWAVRSASSASEPSGEVRLLARVGADSADWHRAALERAGVRPCLRIDPVRPTAVVIALVDAAGERTFVTERGASGALGPDDWEESLLDGVGRLHLSGYLLFDPAGRALAAHAVVRAAARGIGVSVDPASVGFLREYGPSRFLDLLGGVDLLFPNLDEARALTGPVDPRAAEGVLLADHGDLLGAVPGVATAALDSTGAGDAFAGAFLTALLAGAGPLEAASAGCRSGAEAVGLVGGRPLPPE
jgi:sugar/nucleoside kinase (ribokinase family)